MRLAYVTLAMTAGLTGLLASAVVSGTRGRHGAVAPERPRLSTDCGGALAEICIHYRPDFREKCIETYTDLFAALPRDVIVRVIVEKQSDFGDLLRALPPGSAKCMAPVVTGFEITPWAKDRFGTFTGADGVALIAAPPASRPVGGARGNEEMVPPLLARALPRAELLRMPFFFEGGDLICDDDRAYIAATCLARNPPLDVDDRFGLELTIREALGKDLVVIGYAAPDVPDQHIGMYLTPLGGKKVAVADPSLGKELCTGLSKEEIAGIGVEEDESLFEPFYTVREALEQKGIEVVRMPMVLTSKPRVYVTYNNVMLEKRGGTLRVYMPVYGVAALDAAGRAAWEKQGFEVIPVRVAKVYRYSGSLRCLVGILRRSY